MTPRPRGPRAIGVCASTGGPRALQDLLAPLPASFPIPIVVVQHIAVGFLDSLIKTLRQHVAIPIAVAADGARLVPGVWIAPDGAHVRIEAPLRFALERAALTPAQPHRPSGDLMLESLARTVGPAAVAVVLTGMGRDGSNGVAAVRSAGGRVLAQDDAPAYGMPRAAALAGAEVMPTASIAAMLGALA